MEKPVRTNDDLVGAGHLALIPEALERPQRRAVVRDHPVASSAREEAAELDRALSCGSCHRPTLRPIGSRQRWVVTLGPLDARCDSS